MLFNSYIFILLFLPLAWAIYFGLNKLNATKVANTFLVLASLVFYGYNNWKFASVLIAGILVNFLLHVCLLRADKGRRLLLILGLSYNFGILLYFKYFNFFLENMNVVLRQDFALVPIVLPLGISFYTFQQVSFIIDSYKKTAEKYTLDEYALFVSFFPQLIAGPIVLHNEIIPQFRDKTRRKIDYNNIYDGLQYFALGLAKKVLLADSVGRAVDWGYENVLSLNSLSAALVILLYTLQIYFDFSGYCDMAMGIGKLFNIDLVVNFNSPYKAISVNEFWKRWHITLTRFFTTYVYIPLGGNRKGLKRTCVNVMIVFTLSGIWHGADWTFVLWGIMHGIMMVFERIFDKYLQKVPGVIRQVVTFGFISFAWVFFRAEFFRQALSVFKRLLLGGIGGVKNGMVEAVVGNGKELLFGQISNVVLGTGLLEQCIMWIWVIILLLLALFGRNTHEIIGEKRMNKGYRAALILVVLVSIVSISGVSKFLYFNF